MLALAGDKSNGPTEFEMARNWRLTYAAALRPIRDTGYPMKIRGFCQSNSSRSSAQRTSVQDDAKIGPDGGVMHLKGINR